MTKTPHFFDEPPTALEHAINMFERNASSESVGSVHAMSIRVEAIQYSTIEALARFSGMSRNKVISTLLGVALDEVWQGMTDDCRAGVQAFRSEILGQIVATGDFPQAAKGEI